LPQQAGRLEGKVAVLTGAASGIGEGTARRFVAEGARVVVADIQAEKGLRVAKSLGDAARFVRTDVTQESDIAGAVDTAVAEFGQLDVMVNNAGIVGAVGSIVETSAEAFDATMAVLARAVFLGIKHAGRVMLPRRSGSIVSIASTAGVQGGLGPHVYTMAKHGVVGLTKSAASEFARRGIRVNAVAPGNTVTAMTADVVAGDPDDRDAVTETITTMSPLRIPGLPEDIAAAILYLASDEARYVTGQTLVVDAGQTSGSGGPVPFHRQGAEVIREAGRRGIDD
jgi:NAD(P)-dependent dehydrogenase (short-subunit alcohol dehydrogenase family)